MKSSEDPHASNKEVTPRRDEIIGELVALRCPCGRDILCAVRYLGERLGTPVFFDNVPTSETYAERIESCPRCGEHLEFLMLLLKTRRK